ncbi:MAG TPA: alcohol dehydrogenase catalytic domain-containing protein, partial [Candidatus Melainabacteria bacterium]|nr:alcohol dehydrogenase catalytic domain-containing protein [Candidatus Melainabacteria bacterium]
MRALQFVDKKIAVAELPQPDVVSGEALVRVVRAGVCNTDIEITRGYFAYSGTLGHEFVGVVEAAEDAAMVGKRIVADINCACGECTVCLSGGAHHCPTRTVLGIVNRSGAFADYLVVPERNLVMVPDT